MDELATDKATQDVAVADNPGGGTGGCDTNVLRQFMEESIDRTAFIGPTDPDVAKQAHAAGVGAVIDVEMGGKKVSGKDIDGEPIWAKA